MTTMGIAAKLAAAAAAVRYVEKDGVNAFHKYRFTSAASVNAHVNPALVAAGLAIVDTDVVPLSERGAGKDYIVTVKVSITVRDTETSETATFRGIGSGQDAGDKAMMKATTAGAKYAWIVGLCISMGDDPEADEDTDRRASSTRGSTARPQAQPRREEQRASEPQRVAAATPREEPPVDQPALSEPPAALEGFYARIAEIELPSEAVAVWMKHRAEIAKLPGAHCEAAWAALVTRTEEVGKMKNAKVWLRKAIKEEDARRGDEVRA